MIARPARRPAGWVAPGPQPRGHGHDPRTLPGPAEDLAALCGDFSLLQRRDGHRWSLDDLVTAWAACTACADARPTRVCDLGCGIGSVLTMVAWRFPSARGVGIEAQAISADLCRRSLLYNGLDARVDLIEGDLRDVDASAVLALAEPFDLVTGTPPYFNVDHGTVSTLPQRGPCRFETRGGIEDYAAAARTLISDEGWFSVCESARHHARAREALRAARFHVVSELAVVGREGKDPLFFVFVCRPEVARAASVPAEPALDGTLIVRDRRGAWTPAFVRVRRDMGMPTTYP